MKSSRVSNLFLLVLGLLLLLLAACGPSEVEQKATATQIAAQVFATQTAQVSTPVPPPSAQPEDKTVSPSSDQIEALVGFGLIGVAAVLAVVAVALIGGAAFFWWRQKSGVPGPVEAQLAHLTSVGSFTCPACQTPNPPEAHFCKNCGQPLKVETAPPAKPAHRPRLPATVVIGGGVLVVVVIVALALFWWSAQPGRNLNEVAATIGATGSPPEPTPTSIPPTPARAGILLKPIPTGVGGAWRTISDQTLIVSLFDDKDQLRALVRVKGVVAWDTDGKLTEGAENFTEIQTQANPDHWYKVVDYEVQDGVLSLTAEDGIYTHFTEAVLASPTGRTTTDVTITVDGKWKGQASFFITGFGGSFGAFIYQDIRNYEIH